MQETAFGCIPVRTLNEQKEVLLVCKKTIDKSATWWGFPKGHPEGGERPIETAKRELFEETGIADCVIDESRSFAQKYEFERDGQKVEKSVTYFLTTVAPTEPVDVDRTEVIDYRWRKAEEAAEYITHDDLKEILREALKGLATP